MLRILKIWSYCSQDPRRNIRAVKKEGDPIFANSGTAAVLESLEGLFSDFRLKGGQKEFFGSKLDPKVPKSAKTNILQTTDYRKLADPSKGQKGLFYYKCFDVCTTLRQPRVPKNAFFYFFGSYMMKFRKFISRDLYIIIYIDLYILFFET